MENTYRQQSVYDACGILKYVIMENVMFNFFYKLLYELGSYTVVRKRKVILSNVFFFFHTSTVISLGLCHTFLLQYNPTNINGLLLYDERMFLSSKERF